MNGNLAFSRGQWDVEFPQDPDHYYWGEGSSIAVSSHTLGYGLFLPGEVVAWQMSYRHAPLRRHSEHDESVIQRRNAVARERLRRRAVSSGEGHDLGPFGLGRVRSFRDHEIYSAFDFRNNRAHPDVITGDNPDPVTSRSEADWSRSVMFTEAAALGLVNSL